MNFRDHTIKIIGSLHLKVIDHYSRHYHNSLADSCNEHKSISIATETYISSYSQMTQKQ